MSFFTQANIVEAPIIRYGRDPVFLRRTKLIDNIKHQIEMASAEKIDENARPWFFETSEGLFSSIKFYNKMIELKPGKHVFKAKDKAELVKVYQMALESAQKGEFDKPLDVMMSKVKRRARA